MSELRYSTSMSLDGYVAGPNQREEHPLGEGGELLHEWMRELAVWRKAAGREGGTVNASTAVVEHSDVNIGAIVMGRNMFGGGPGPWGDDPWRGWWGENPPFHMPVIVLTHHRRQPLVMLGATTFSFVTDGPAAALEQARQAAGGRDVALSGGAGVAKQFLAAGLIDCFQIHLVPVLLGGGVRLFEDPASARTRYQQTQVVEAPGVTHITYRSPNGKGP